MSVINRNLVRRGWYPAMARVLYGAVPSPPQVLKHFSVCDLACTVLSVPLSLSNSEDMEKLLLLFVTTISLAQVTRYQHK